jgi:hypothetical protein
MLLVLLTLVYADENWTMQATDKTKITAAEIIFVR